jgi:hypothetical protein
LTGLFAGLLRHGTGLLTSGFRGVSAGVPPRGDFVADLDVQVASSALFGVGLVVAVDWLVFQPDRRIEDVEESLRAIVRKVAVG